MKNMKWIFPVCLLSCLWSSPGWAATINVQSSPYNATGNGSTDDTGAIQSAITAAGVGDTVLFPAGTYKVSSTLHLKSNCSYTGQGFPVLLGYQGTGVGGYQIFELDGNSGSAQNVTITGLIFDGGGIWMTENTNNYSATISNITVRNNIFRNIINSNVNFGMQNYGFAAGGGVLTNSSIDHNFFSHIADGDRLDAAYAGSLTGDSVDSNKSAVQVWATANTSFSNNVFDWIAGDGIHIGETQLALSLPGITINNNIFTNNHRDVIEIQVWGAVSTLVSGNMSGHVQWDYWGSDGTSFASEGTIIEQNNIFDNFHDLDGANQYPQHNPNGNGYCTEIGGTNSVVNGDVCMSHPGTAFGFATLSDGIAVTPVGNTLLVENATYCGPYGYGWPYQNTYPFPFEDDNPPPTRTPTGPTVLL